MANEVYRSTISLRLTSSVTSADFMISTMGMTPTFGWNKGESRMLPSGRELKHVKRQSYACFHLFESDDRWLPELLEGCVAKLSEHRDFFHQLRSEEDGGAELFIGWFLSRYGGDTLHPPLLLDVANLGLALSFDIYPSGTADGH